MGDKQVKSKLTDSLQDIEDKPEADVAQLVEQPIRNRQVSGSSPLVGSILSATYEPIRRCPLHNCCTTDFFSTSSMASIHFGFGCTIRTAHC
jgi:hypothetical protein